MHYIITYLIILIKKNKIRNEVAIDEPCDLNGEQREFEREKKPRHGEEFKRKVEGEFDNN